MRIVFHVLPALSHFFPTVDLALRLRSKGHEVLYLSSTALERVVVENGFTFLLQRDLIPDESLLLHITNPLRRKLECKKQISYSFLTGDYYNEVLSKTEPDFFFVDSSLVYFSVVLKKKHVSFCLFHTKVSMDKEFSIPPLSSGFIPSVRNSMRTLLAIEWFWFTYLLSKWYKELIKECSYSKVSFHFLSLRFVQRNNLSKGSHLKKNRFGHFAFNDVMEIILTPSQFDFPGRRPRLNQLYLYNFGHIAMRVQKEGRSNLQKCIYFSLGSWDTTPNDKKLAFLNRLFTVFKKRSERLIASVGAFYDYIKIDSLPLNITVYDFCNQAEILASTDVMITYGGMQSIEECIFSGVPMYVFPVANDQPGNCARILFHQIGVKGDFENETEMEMNLKLDDLLVNSRYKDNLMRLRESIAKESNFALNFDILLKRISAPSKSKMFDIYS